MARENVEVVRRLNSAFNSGDIDAVLALVDPSFEAQVPAEFSPEPDIYRGHDGIRRYFDSFNDAMSEICFHQDGFREAGPSVVVEVRLTAKGRTTGIAVEQRFAQVWTLRDRRAVEVRTYASMPEALASVGLGA